jgi:hypothetical protein
MSSVVTSRFKVAGFSNTAIPQHCGFHGKLEHISCLGEYLYIINAEAIFYICPCYSGARGAVVAKALRYKPVGRGFDSQWCDWNFSVT